MVIGSTADMASPLPLQHANTVCYIGDYSSLPDDLVSDSIPQSDVVGKSEMKTAINRYIDSKPN
jgi:hypothetical protein